VQKRILSTIAVSTVMLSLFIASCSKLDTTDIGSDLLPAVDNVNTFDTLLAINSAMGPLVPDSSVIAATDDHVLGKITSDPLFGTTDAGVYAQFKPGFYPFYYGNAGDTINPSLDSRTGFDSVVLCLAYRGFWGDSITPFTVQVSEVALNAGGMWDSIGQSSNITYAPPVAGTIVTQQVDIASLGTTKIYSNHRDSSVNQVRIRLSTAFANKLFALDTNYLGASSPFRSDSLFRAFTNGIAIKVTGGNGLLYTNLADSATKIEVHFRRKNAGVIDTTYTAFRVNTTADGAVPLSATANNITRTRPSQVFNPAPGELYLQTTPGTYANLTIPALSTLSNRIIHRAEIIVNQIPNNPVTDGFFSPPNYLYIDLKDTGATEKYKPIYFDLNPSVAYDPDYLTNTDFPNGGIDYTYFGGFARNKTDVFGNSIKYYNFNITRYVQQIVTKHTNNYPLRLYAPYNLIYPQHSVIPISFSNRIAYGRVKVGGGNNANYKMQLRIVYSKI